LAMSVEDRSWAAGRSKEEEEEEEGACCKRFTRQLAALEDDEKSMFSFDKLCGVGRKGSVSDVIPCAGLRFAYGRHHMA